MNTDGKKNMFASENLDNYIKKKRDEITKENRKLNREESAMKKRKEKLLSSTNDFDVKQIQEDLFNENKPDFKNQLLTFDSEKKLANIIKIRKLLSKEKNPPIQEILNTGILSNLVHFLKEDNDVQLKFEIAWILTNIASGTSEQTYKLIESEAVPILIELFQGSNDNLTSQCVWALGNIAGDSIKCREYLLKTNLLEVLLFQISKNKSVSFLRNAVWTLSNLCREKPGLNKNDHPSLIIVLGKIILSDDIDILTDVCWALSYISDGSSNIIQGIINSGMLTRITELLMHEDTKVQTPALRTIGNIVTGDDFQTQAVINSSALPCLLTLLNSNKKSIKREACWAISNITAGNVSQIQAVIDSGIIPVLVNLLESSEFDVKKEAAWAISNATTGGEKKQIDFLLKFNPLPALINLLDSSDIKIIKVILEGLENILENGEISEELHNKNTYVLQIEKAGGLEKLEKLQQHPNDEIYESAIKILERFFGAEEDIYNDQENADIISKNQSINLQIPECNFMDPDQI